MWSSWSFRSAAADVFGAGFRPWVLDEEGALIVKDEQRCFGFDEVGEGAEQGAADVETDPAQEDRPVVSSAG